jgi:hypothetical protein
VSLRNPTRTLATVIFALLALALGAGCSGDEGKNSYLEDANAICAKVVDQFPDPSLIRPGSPAADQQFQQLANARGKAIRELRLLEPPPDDAATAAKMLRRLAKSQRLLKDAGRLGESEMVVPTLIAAAQEDDEAHEAARILGLEDCAGL